MANPTIKEFIQERETAISEMAQDKEFTEITQQWMQESCEHKYSYNYTWMGRPIIQYPQDIVAMQEIIWDIKPDAIIETGVAHGGSLILYASLLEMAGCNAEVLGIDIDIRKHNREAIEAHPMYKYITLLEGSSIDDGIVKKAAEFVKNKRKVIVILDSNHTHEHVLKELELYSRFVSENSYLVVFDTIVEDLPERLSSDRPWGPGNNPKTAVHKFLISNDEFEIDKRIQNKLMISVAPDGYLKRTKA